MPLESAIATTSMLVLFAYLIGSISTAIIVCRVLRLPDPRASGSKNPGATNVMRIGGKKAAAMTLAGDLFKCTIPMWIGSALGLTTLEVLIVGLAAFFGHLYPLFFRFEGGKGIASFFGLLLGYAPTVAVFATIFWIVGFKATKVSAIGAASLLITAPILSYLYSQSWPQTAVIASASLWSAWRHRENFSRLIQGKELGFNGESSD